MKAAAATLNVSRSRLCDRLSGSAKPRQGYQKARDAAVLPRIQALVAKRPTCGYRRITALLNRRSLAQGLPPVNHKRVYRIMERNDLLLRRSGFDRAERNHDDKVIMMLSNMSWCSDGLEFTCWNGDVIRPAFLIGAHDREFISWRALANARVSGSDVRDMLLEAVEHRFGAHCAPKRVEVLSDNGSAYTAKDTRLFAQQLGLKSCFTPMKSPQSSGMSEAFVKTPKRD
ncbi:HTH-like domain-containing protein [Paracoccus homiensis]|uniref:HTH-like domain-containing protein n=1 Tax=Paracoccus homiensis TaxID=364199 RepID=A0A1I0GPB2_9RHOB|nr:HTH-like domain-containing protein [Paracoccus homiensis]